MLGRLAKSLFPVTDSLPHVRGAGDVFYIVGVLAGIILWGFATVWLVVAIIMIATFGRFPFNMGWWGFIFPVGVFTLLTISIGEELESRFFKVLSCVSLHHLCSLHFDEVYINHLPDTSGLHGGMCHHVACGGRRDNQALHQRENVLRTLPGYGFICEKIQLEDHCNKEIKGR